MKAPEFFGALVRVLGIWEIVHGVTLAPSIFSLFGQQSVQAMAVRQAVRMTVANSGLHILLGVLLFFGAPLLVRLAYGRRPDSPAADGEAWQVPQVPAEIITPTLFLIAGALFGLHMWLAQPDRITPTVVPGTVHIAVVASIGCAAVAYLWRKRHKPLYTFLVTWSAFFGVSAVANAMRSVF
jgi:hypothetical protein